MPLLPESQLINDFSGGWNPSVDATGGPKNVLLKMNNLTLDEQGAITLCGGVDKISTVMPAAAHTIYSKFLNSVRYRYAALQNGTIRRNDSAIIAGGHTSLAAFGSAYDYVFICSGDLRLKDTGTDITNLYVNDPSNTFGAHSEITIFSGALDGTYTWVQVKVERNAAFEAKSQAGLETTPLLVSGTTAGIRLTKIATSEEANEIWLYRRGGNLDKYYRVAVINTGYDFTLETNTWVDTVSDEDALIENITLNDFRNTLSLTDTPDPILAMVGPVYGRMLYFTYKSILISDLYDPTSYDTRYVVNIAGSNSERFLWAKKVGENTILVGTSKDIYVLTGTFVELPDGFLDVYYRGLGVASPPIAYDATVHGDSVYYMAADGWRGINSTGATQLLSAGTTNLLYQGKTRYGYAPAIIAAPGDIRFSCAVVKNKLWCVVPYSLSNRRMEVYDFVKNYWRPVNISPNVIFAEEDNNLFGFFPDDLFLRSIDTPSKLVDIGGSGLGQAVTLMTPFFNPGEAQGVKNTNTTLVMRIKAKIGGGSINVYGYRDDSETALFLGNLVATSAVEDIVIDLENLTGIPTILPFGVAKSWRFELSGTVQDLLINSIYIEYRANSRQLSRLFTTSTNFGHAGRKRCSGFKFTINGGVGLLFTPIVDGVTLTSLSINTGGQTQTVIYNSSVDIVGKDFVFSIVPSALGNPSVSNNTQFFEMYSEIEPINLELFPPALNRVVVPSTNYGTKARKRLYSIPFKIDTRGANVVCTPKIDNIVGAGVTINSSYPKTFDLKALLADLVPLLGVDFEYTFTGTGFEFYGMLEMKDFETFPTPVNLHVIHGTNLGTANKKKLGSWPFVLENILGDIYFTHVIDGVPGAATLLTTPSGKRTHFYYFPTPTYGVDVAGFLFTLDPLHTFELYGFEKPEVLQILPPARRFYTFTAKELFKYGRIKSLAIRLISFTNTTIPYKLYFSDTLDVSGSLTVSNGIEDIKDITLPSTTGGRLLRIELGPVSNDFHIFYINAQAAKTGRDTEFEWITLEAAE